MIPLISQIRGDQKRKGGRKNEEGEFGIGNWFRFGFNGWRGFRRIGYKAFNS